MNLNISKITAEKGILSPKPFFEKKVRQNVNFFFFELGPRTNFLGWQIPWQIQFTYSKSLENQKEKSYSRKTSGTYL